MDSPNTSAGGRTNPPVTDLSAVFAPLTGSALQPRKPREVWEPQMPAPAKAPETKAIKHPKFGAAVQRWVYRDAAGSPLFAVARFGFTRDDGATGKETLPYTYGRCQWVNAEGAQLDKTRWHFKRPKGPVPLYGIDRLAARPDAEVLLCEGEKAADAAQMTFPDCVGIASQGGAKASGNSDWSPVAGRKVRVWPDADEVGHDFALKAAELMKAAGAAEVTLVRIVAAEWPRGWDLADDPPPGVTVERLRELLDAAADLDVADDLVGDDVSDEPAAEEGVSDGDAAGEGANVTPMALERAYRLSDLEFATQRPALARELGITATALADLRRKHLVEMRKLERERDRLAEQADKVEQKRLAAEARADTARANAEAKTEQKRIAAEAKAAAAKAMAEGQAEHRAKGPDAAGETLWPYGIEHRDDGLYYTLDDETPEMWLCDPIEVLGMARDAAGESWGLWLRWRDADRRVHTWAMPNRLIMARFGELEVELVDRGLRIDTNGLQRSYLRHAPCAMRHALGGVRTALRVSLADAPGWSAPTGAGGSYSLIDGETIGSANESVVLKSPPENAAAKMAQAGSLDEWKSDVAAKAVGNPAAAFAISAAFAGPLLGPLGESSGGFQIFGRSKAGKTLLMRMGFSVWGSPRKSGLLRDWRSTANGLESAAEESNDAFLTLDEVHQAEPRDVVAAIYQLANESGKQRLRQDASARKRRTWRTVVFSTGEVDLTTMASKANQTLPPGAEVRLPSIPIDGETMWPNLHGAASATELMAGLQKALAKQYGTAIRPFLTELASTLADNDGTLNTNLEEMRLLFIGVVGKNADPQAKEVARRAALIALAGEMATACGLLPWKLGEAEDAAKKMLLLWIVRRGGFGSTEESLHVRAVRGFLAEFGASRFVALTQKKVQGSVGRWVETHPDRPIPSRMGWRRSTLKDNKELTGQDEFLIDQDGWQKICAAGNVDPTETAKTLKDAGHLIPGEGKNLMPHVRVPGAGKIRLYRIQPSIFKAGDEVAVVGTDSVDVEGNGD